MSVLRRPPHDNGTADAAVLAEINITPFTDVLLVLLIIFMILAALVVPPGFERQFPPCACVQPYSAAHPRQLAVVVLRSGEIRVDGKHVSTTALYPLLAQIHQQAPKTRVKIFADAKAPYGAIMRVLDAAKAGGLGDVSFVTE
ncbi:MAG TPA: biopolymer transporter ExbD [Candidatus Baltobacteraceae bacterium]